MAFANVLFYAIAGFLLIFPLSVMFAIVLYRRPPFARLWLTMASIVLGMGVWLRGTWWPIALFIFALAWFTPALRKHLVLPLVVFAVLAAPQVIRSSWARGTLTLSTRSSWHVALVGLGYYPNPYGLEAKDEVIFKLTQDKYGVQFRTEDYWVHDQAAKKEFFSILRKDPKFVLGSILLDDIFFIQSRNAVFAGFFDNIGDTRREGVELGVQILPTERLSLYANYAFTHATFRDPAQIFSIRADSAFAGSPLAGPNAVGAGNRLPLVPDHQVKMGGLLTLPAAAAFGAVIGMAVYLVRQGLLRLADVTDRWEKITSRY
jgi:hypothetical protein